VQQTKNNEDSNSDFTDRKLRRGVPAKLCFSGRGQSGTSGSGALGTDVGGPQVSAKVSGRHRADQAKGTSPNFARP
jgi:hypothetical protein